MASNRSNRLMVRAPEHKKPLLALSTGIVTETAANTATSLAIQTPVAPGAFIAMRIHRIRMELSFPDTVAATRTAVTAAILTREPAAGLPQLNDPSVIVRSVIVADNATSGGGATSGDHLSTNWDFGEQGLLLVDNQLILRVLGTANVGVKTAIARIWYTLETLETSEWLAALSSAGVSI